MTIKRGWAVGDEKGPDAFFEGANFIDALGEAEKLYPRHTRIEFEGDLNTLQSDLSKATPNASREVSSAKMPELALKHSGLGKVLNGKLVSRVDFAEAMAMSKEEAYERLYPIFRYKYESGPSKGKYVKEFDQLSRLRDSLLTENFKLSKSQAPKIGEEPGLSAGPNLLPHALAKKFSKLELLMVGNGLCVGSSRACRETCLVYSGNNPVADQHGRAKLVKTEALLKEPNAWVRMLVEAIEKHIRSAHKQGLRPYVRPNLLSDIPWEIVCPELFTSYFDRRDIEGKSTPTGLRFYDYTKVPGRLTDGLNYDLTFSFSGTNEDWCLEELQKGRRVAVVYWLRDRRDSVTRKVWNGYPVIDGDRHDMRPLDPGSVVVGLTYKNLYKQSGTGFSKVTAPPKFAQKFIRETFYDTDTGDLMVAATPLDLGVSSAAVAYTEPNEVAIGP